MSKGSASRISNKAKFDEHYDKIFSIGSSGAGGIPIPSEPEEPVLEKITPNGEITFDPVKKEYTVWDETYADTVCTTAYPQVARAAFKAYCEHYLDQPEQTTPMPAPTAAPAVIDSEADTPRCCNDSQ